MLVLKHSGELDYLELNTYRGAVHAQCPSRLYIAAAAL
jgi:hypothetical protein